MGENGLMLQVLRSMNVIFVLLHFAVLLLILRRLHRNKEETSSVAWALVLPLVDQPHAHPPDPNSLPAFLLLCLPLLHRLSFHLLCFIDLPALLEEFARECRIGWRYGRGWR